MSTSRAELARRLIDPRYLLALGFGSGLAPRAPGTFGSLAALVLFLPLSLLPPLWYAVVVVVMFGVGTWVSDFVAKDLAIKDPGMIVIDEFVGLWIALFLLPAGWIYLLIGFALFRLFDVLKPWPVSWCDEQLKGGFGIMMDDVVAGIFALGAIQLGAFFVANVLTVPV